MNILLGLTGSVATTIAPKIVAALETVLNCTEVRVIMTDKAAMFYNPEKLQRDAGVKVYTERDEWTWTRIRQPLAEDKDGLRTVHPPEFVRSDKWQKDDPILHVELAKWASCLVVAPATVNTIAKMANGVCDNLLTSVFAAWDTVRPVVIAPACNTRMWESPANGRNINKLRDCGESEDTNYVTFVSPVEKELACGDTGVGALANAADIAFAVDAQLRWGFPFDHNLVDKFGYLSAANDAVGIPVGRHPGAFGAIRKHDRHCGVDLYCRPDTNVYTVEPGRVVSVEDFTGQAAGCPWWLDTKAVKVEGASGVVCYGEIKPRPYMKVGDVLGRNAHVGRVIPVLPPEKRRPDIPGHSCSMLHLQLYKHGTTHKDHDWGRDGEMPDNVLDPTPYIVWSRHASGLKKLDMPQETT